MSVIVDGLNLTGGSLEGIAETAASFAAAHGCAAASLSVGRPGGISSVPDTKEVEKHLQFVRVGVKRK